MIPYIKTSQQSGFKPSSKKENKRQREVDEDTNIPFAVQELGNFAKQ